MNKSGLYCFVNMNLRNRKCIDQNPLSKCEPNNYRGTLFGLEKNTHNIIEYNTYERI